MTDVASHGVTSRVLLGRGQPHQHPTLVFEVIYGKKVMYESARPLPARTRRFATHQIACKVFAKSQIERSSRVMYRAFAWL
jgi:hypothetical protein